MSASQKLHKPTTCRMFETPLIEYFSRIHPVSAFAFWLPLLAGLIWWPLHNGLAPLHSLGFFALGWLAWTLTEYVLHRFVFHYMGPEPWKRRFNFVLHGVHHDFPRDAARLVMPLGVSIPLGLVFYLVMSVLVGGLWACAMFAGFGAGYLAYDGVHYMTHHLPTRTRLTKYLKRYHMVHHFTGYDAKWGVSSPLWDYVFRTADEQAVENS